MTQSTVCPLIISPCTHQNHNFSESKKEPSNLLYLLQAWRSRSEQRLRRVATKVLHWIEQPRSVIERMYFYCEQPKYTSLFESIVPRPAAINNDTTNAVPNLLSGNTEKQNDTTLADTAPNTPAPKTTGLDLAKFKEAFNQRGTFAVKRAPAPVESHSARAEASSLEFLTRAVRQVETAMSNKASKHTADGKAVQALSELTQQWEFRHWRLVSAAVQRLLLSYCAARVREIQQFLSKKDTDCMELMFQRMNRFAIEAQPGWVNGLGKKNTPAHGSWRSDAQHYRRELELFLGPLHEQPAAATIQTAATTEPIPAKPAGIKPDQEVANDTSVDSEYPLFSGKRVLLVTGDERGDRFSSVQRQFGMTELVRVAATQGRIDSAVDSIKHGRYDLVLLCTKWMGHKYSIQVEKACQQGAIACIRLTQGYGTASLRNIARLHSTHSPSLLHRKQCT